LRAPFARFSAAYRASGRFGECLDALKDDLADPAGWNCSSVGHWGLALPLLRRTQPELERDIAHQSRVGGPKRTFSERYE
jgi:hypothetical protein